MRQDGSPVSAQPAPPAGQVRVPRVRLAAAVGASVGISLLNDPGLLLAAGGLGLALLLAAILSSGNMSRLLRRLLVVNVFVLMLWLTLPWELGANGLAASDEGRRLALLISLRTNAIALCCIGLLAGMDAFAVARAASGLGLPPKMARLLALMVRYFGLLDDSRRRIERAMRARGFRPGFNLRTLQVLAQLVALLLVHAMLRAERVGMAMRARGFAPHTPPASPANRRRQAAAPALGASLLLLGIVLGSAWLGIG
ncbi:MAG: hypothetical protein CVU28_13560 [Betaproteobacteria bacterium HGW-Betaproteobacteria-21]|nr:MAG: hypothetical protein CVU28_13560 [Betaproteobacteria bacterium HGW-Betaproteobacteria-21]